MRAMSDETIRECAEKTGKSWGNLEALMEFMEIPEENREAIRELAGMPGSYERFTESEKQALAEMAALGDVLRKQVDTQVLKMAEGPSTEPPLSCTYIAFAQAKLRRIREWAEQNDHVAVSCWADQAWDDIDKVRKINKELRKAAYGRATVHTDMTDEAWFAETERDWATLEELAARPEVET